MKKYLLLFIALLGNIIANAQDGHLVNVTINNNTDSLVYLCYYFGNGSTVQKIDSAKLEKGTTKIEMKDKKKITSGIYMLLFKDNSPQVEILMKNGEPIRCSFDKSDVVNTIKFEKDEENTAFYDFKKYINEMNPKINELNEKLKTCKNAIDTGKINTIFEDMNKDILAYRGKYANAHPTSLTNVLFKAMKEPVIPEDIKKIKTKKMKDSAEYWYYKNNFWNDFDFSDDRIIYSPIYDGKLDKFFKLIPSVPDSFNKEADKIMSRSKCGSDMYKYSFWWIARNAGLSKVMGMDESYVYMIEKYLMGQSYCNFLDTASLRAYKEDAMKMGTSIIGQVGREVALPDADGNVISMQAESKKADFLILAFYDPTCHHCEKEVPSMDSVLNIVEKELKINITRYGVQNANEDEKWKKFIVDKKLNNHWIHVHDPNRVGRYRADYNVLTNPVFYLIDNQGVIRGKRIDHSNIAGLIKYLHEDKLKKK